MNPTNTVNLPAIAWEADESCVHTRMFAVCGRFILEWWPYNNSWCIGTVNGIGPIDESKDENRNYNGGNSGQRACEAAYYKALGITDHPPLTPEIPEEVEKE